MDSKILMSDSVCRDEVVDYIASRYSITPQQVIEHFLYLEGIITDTDSEYMLKFHFEENEIAILRDMGIRPSNVEFVDTTK